jgi:ApbE superfamily uncharacterized protein (UPF0280 family)
MNALTVYASRNTTEEEHMARDEQRIELVLDELRRYWKANPQLRLGQILENTANRSGSVVYNMEDDTFINNLTPFPRTFDFSVYDED